jgi:hypothetical protein
MWLAKSQSGMNQSMAQRLGDPDVTQLVAILTAIRENAEAGRG